MDTGPEYRYIREVNKCKEFNAYYKRDLAKDAYMYWSISNRTWRTIQPWCNFRWRHKEDDGPWYNEYISYEEFLLEIL